MYGSTKRSLLFMPHNYLYGYELPGWNFELRTADSITRGKEIRRALAQSVLDLQLRSLVLWFYIPIDHVFGVRPEAHTLTPTRVKPCHAFLETSLADTPFFTRPE